MLRHHRYALGLLSTAALASSWAFHSASAQSPGLDPLPIPVLPGLEPQVPVLPPPSATPQNFVIPLQPKAPDFNLGVPPQTETAPRPRPAKTPGDTPMPGIKDALLGAAISGALMAGPSPAQEKKETEKAPMPVVVDKTAELKAEIAELKKQLKELSTTQKQIGDAILGRNEGKKPEDAGLHDRLDKMAESIKKLDEKVAKLSEQVAANSRTANSSPLATGEDKTPKGIVRLVNDYHVDVSIIVNSKSYVLKPSQTQDVVLVPGEFTFALPQSGGVESRSKIKDGETVTLRIK